MPGKPVEPCGGATSHADGTLHDECQNLKGYLVGGLFRKRWKYLGKSRAHRASSAGFGGQPPAAWHPYETLLGC
jgi:hypothetical protein